MKKCKQGYYYCYTDKKCKRIPGGYRVTYGGYLRREKDSDNSETDDNKNNGNGSGNGNHSNGNGNGNGSSSNGGGNGGGGGVSEEWSSKYKQSIDCNNPKGFSQRAHCRGRKKVNEEKKDHEYSMARSQLKTIKNAASRLEKKMGKKGEGELKAWVQSKITKAADYIDTAADYVTNEETIAEKRDGKSAKSKGYSLRDWFRGGGWKQAGGKYDGKPCARQPGQTTKPYCRDADDRAAMSKDERDKRAAKKRREDPNPDRKGAAKIVTQKNSFEPEGNLVDEGKKDACYHKVKSRYSVWPSAYASGALVKCRKVGAANWGNKTKKESFSNWREDMLLEGLEDKLKGMTASQIEDLIKANKGAEDKIRETLAKMKSATPKPQGKGAQLPNIPKTTETYKRGGGEGRTTYQRGGSDRVSYQRRQTVTRADVQGGTEAAKRAASGQGRYRPGTGVTPDFKLDPKFKPPGSRGMSGRVRGRGKLGLAIGAATLAAPFVVGAIKKAFNKEDYNYSNWRDDFHATEIESVDIIKPKSLQPTQGLGSDMLGEKKDIPADVKGIAKELDKAVEMHKSQAKRLRKAGISEENINEKCWKGYEKKGMKTMFGKRYPNCVKKKKTRKEEVELDEKKDPCWDTHEMKGMKKKGNRMVPNCVPKEQVSDWRADVSLQEKKAKKDYDGDGKIETGEEEYKGSRDKAIKKAIAMKEDWQKSNRKDGVDGMSQKSVDAYKRENPGSKLKTAVTGKVKKGSKDAKRRKSFCSRSKGQKDMHNIDCTKTPDKKICKARKRWRC